MVCVQQLANAMDLDWALVQFLGWFQYLRWTACYRKGFSPGAWSLLADGMKSHNLPPEASARASLQKLWEATGAELLFAARLTGQQAEDGRPRPDFSVHLRWQLPKPFPAVTFDDRPLLLHPSLQHLLPTLEASDAQATGCRLHAPQRTPGGRLVPGRVLSAVLFLLVCWKSTFRKIWLLATCGPHCQFGQMPVSLTDARQEARANN